MQYRDRPYYLPSALSCKQRASFPLPLALLLLHIPLLKNQHHVLPPTAPKFHHILIQHPHVPRRLHTLPVQYCPVPTLQIQQVQPHLRLLLPVLVLPDHLPELQDRVLGAAALVLRQHVRDRALPPDQPARLVVQDVLREQGVTLEDVEVVLLCGRRALGVGRLVVLEDDVGVGDAVGGCGEEACWGVVGFLLFGFRVRAGGGRGGRAGAGAVLGVAVAFGEAGVGVLGGEDVFLGWEGA